MAGLDSSPPADSGTTLAGAGARPLGGSSGPIAALLAALASAQSKSAHKGAQFSLPGDPTDPDTAAAAADAPGGMTGLFGSFSGKSFGKGQGHGALGLSAASSLNLALSGTTLTAKPVRAPAELAPSAAGPDIELASPTGAPPPSSGKGQRQGRGEKSTPGLPEPLPAAAPILAAGAVSSTDAGSSELIPFPTEDARTAVPPPPALPLAGAVGTPAGPVAIASSGLPGPTAVPLTSAKNPTRPLPVAIGNRGGEGSQATLPDTRAAAASASADGAGLATVAATPTEKGATKAADAALPSLPAGGGEKFAGFSAGAGNGGAPSGNESNKNSLYYSDKEDTKQTNAVGTTSAQSAAVMPSSRSNRTSTPAGEPRAFLSPASSAPTLPTATATVAGPTASAAHRAIENIARIADAQATRAGSTDSVSFGFKVGDQNLTVRVEMRGGEVRTQFSTDSSDLRSALASEWSTLANGAADRSYHFSAPVFTTADGRPADAGGDTGGSSRQAPSPFPADSGRFVSASDETAEIPSGIAAAAAPVTAQHLHTFA